MFTLTSFVVISTLAMFPGDGRSGDTKPAGHSEEGAAFCFCQADFNHSGEIDGADLGHLLADWGGPGSDLNGSGVTDGADLGILLGEWGPCSAVPANDLCSNALPIGEGTIGFCTNGATTSGPVYSFSSGCIEYGYDSIDSDIWYLYTAPAFGKLTVSTCGTTWDTRVAAYGNVLLNPITQCPGAGAPFTYVVACNDDFPACGLGSQITFDVYQGLQYLIRVGGYVGHSGEGTLTLEFTSQGQTCDDAIDLGFVNASGTDVAGTTLDNDPAADVSPCALNDTVPEWYKFRTDCPFSTPYVVVSTCNGYTDFDTVISVWKEVGGLCTGQFIDCNDDSSDTGCSLGAFNRKSKLSFTADDTATYYIRVSGYQGAKGNFLLVVGVQCN